MMGPGRLIVVLTALLAGCSLFAPREPEPPLSNAGTFSQPDTPEQVVENLQAAIAELNAGNHRRSLAEALVFRPTASAEARETIWGDWGRAQEDAYFSTMVKAASVNAGHRLDLNDRTFTLLDAERYQLDATYVLNVFHSRPGVPVRVQGRLVWLIEQREDGLWELTQWTDQELADSPTWSDLKAAFIK